MGILASPTWLTYCGKRIKTRNSKILVFTCHATLLFFEGYTSVGFFPIMV